MKHVVLGFGSVALFALGAYVIIANVHGVSRDVLIFGGSCVLLAYALAFPTSLQQLGATAVDLYRKAKGVAQ
jgi:hypothetical protein